VAEELIYGRTQFAILPTICLVRHLHCRAREREAPMRQPKISRLLIDAESSPEQWETGRKKPLKRTNLVEFGLAVLTVAATLLGAAGTAQAQAKKPNILVIMTDDVGVWNISAYHRGMMGGRTPNIDRIAYEGALFTDYYAQQSCTAGRAAFITGQQPFRTGLLAAGPPGSPLGLQKEDPPIADLLKPLGYSTAQIGKNHLGDRNEFLPTVHGFDYFYGNLYHLNAEEEPEDSDYPKESAFMERFGPRGVLRCVALTADNPAAADPRFGPCIQSLTILENSSVVMPAWVTVASSSTPLSLWQRSFSCRLPGPPRRVDGLSIRDVAGP
jgi:hypothetical protein